MDAYWTFMSETHVFGVTLAELGGKVLLVAVVALVARIVERILAGIMRHALEAAEVPSASILINIMRAVVWSLALMTVLEPVFGIQPTAFVAALGVGSVALSLGLQDTVSNLIGGLSLMMSKVIIVGDVIKVGDFTGTVVDINWRSTTLRDAYGQVNIIPNSVLSKTALVKLSEFTRTRCQLTLVIKHGTEIDDVIADVARTARDTLGKKVNTKLGVDVSVTGFDASGIQATANVHLNKGVDFDSARTALVTRLADCPWAARVA